MSVQFFGGMFKVIKCAGTLATTIASCVATGLTGGAAIALCVGGVVGTGHQCASIVCDVLNFVGITGC